MDDDLDGLDVEPAPDDVLTAAGLTVADVAAGDCEGSSTDTEGEECDEAALAALLTE
jgi:hypothetical protein